MKDKLRPLEKIEALSADQRQQLADWLLSDMTLDNVAEKAQAEFSVEIPRTTLHRFRKRCEVTDYLDDSLDSARARAELIRTAATGKANFCQATINLLEKQAFELAPATREDGVLDTLKALFFLINAHRNTSVRERMATVQEKKATLREKEAELKKGDTRVSRVAFGVPPNGSDPQTALRDPHSARASDELGPLALTLDDVERRACKQFNLPYTGPSELGSAGVPPESSPLSPVSSPAEPSSAIQNQKCLRLDGQTKVSSLPSVQSNSDLGGTGLPPAASSDQSSKLPAQSSVTTAEAVYRQTEKIPNISASGSAGVPPADSGVSPEQSPKPAPAPSSLAAAEPLYRQTQKSSTIVQQPVPSAQTPQPPALTKAHAIKRWRAHIRRPAGTPEPDGSWRDECPCGGSLPCAKHAHLCLVARGYKPQHPEYEKAMKEAGVYYYIPTAQEIGCTQEELDLSRDLFAFNPRLIHRPDPRIDPFATPPWPSTSVRG